jgi:hypothetical protein
MADQLSWSAAGELLAGFAPEGSLRTAVLLVYGLCVAVAPFIYKYYLGVVAQGAAPEGSLERQDYERLLASLAGGNLAARLYAKWLTAFLDWIEGFFGDAGLADRTLFPRAFGLKKPAPLWTAPAFDRCLFLAMLYPFATIFVIWAVSGHVGPAERALDLKPDISGWRRYLSLGIMGFLGATFLRYTSLFGGNRRGSLAVDVSLVFAMVFGSYLTLDVVGPIGFSGILAISGAVFFVFVCASFGAGTGTGVGAVYYAFSVAAALAVSRALGKDAALPIMVGLFGAGGGAVAVLGRSAVRCEWQGPFLLSFLLAMIMACLAEAALLSPVEAWIPWEQGLPPPCRLQSLGK